jgi:hypothetical protein
MGERQRLGALRRHHPSREGLQVARTKTSPGFGLLVSGLPGFPVASEPIMICPLQWRGRAGFAPASVNRVRDMLTYGNEQESCAQVVSAQVSVVSRRSPLMTDG